MKKITLLLFFVFSLCTISAQDLEDFVFNYYVCETDNCITLQPLLGDVNEEDVDCFAWESEASITSPQQQQQEVCPTEDTEYSLFIIDDDGNIIEEILYKVHIVKGEPPARLVPIDTFDIKSGLVANSYSCNIASRINEFVSNNNQYDITIQRSSLYLYNNAQTSRLEEVTFSNLANEIDLFLDFNLDVDAIDRLLDFFFINNLDFLAISPRGIRESANSLCQRIPEPDPTGWSPMTAIDFRTQTFATKAALKQDYIGQEARVEHWWSCRVLGPAQEEVALRCLNLPQSNTEPNGVGFMKRPDGYIEKRLYDLDHLEVRHQPFFIEVKGRYADNIFSWGLERSVPNNRIKDQGIRYGEFLSNPANTYLPDKSALHGLYMILTGDVALDNDLVHHYSALNIPVYVSELEKITLING
ncbi:hypothetical protein FUA23_21685 [Neolewinella aurantiaca]|uniref:Uncharacterized protein n=1 Tax=Neolewinella aurantiaca TaxID=2602767 RepID=A0A5C7FH95_9BACT|nr:hypothetical protein [Neolewinella aurantiaca]TXF83083.1 hypothetical protein FUA23_21685 [Neolewinella aurantiaca]